MKLRMAIGAVAVLLMLAGACASEDQAQPQATATPQATASATINVSLSEYFVLPAPKLGTAGDVTFTVENKGAETHEFVVAATDLDPAKLPTVEDGSVDEEKVDVKGEIEDLAAGKTEEVKLDLAAGKYVLFCNVVDEEHEGDIHAHYKLGMRTGFTVQ